MRTLWTAVAAVALVMGVLPTAGANDLKGPGPGYIATDNVEWLGNIPVNTDSAGGRLLDGYFYISDDRGLTIYDTKDPANPQRVGRCAGDRHHRGCTQPWLPGALAYPAADGRYGRQNAVDRPVRLPTAGGLTRRAATTPVAATCIYTVCMQEFFA